MNDYCLPQSIFSSPGAGGKDGKRWDFEGDGIRNVRERDGEEEDHGE